MVDHTYTDEQLKDVRFESCDLVLQIKRDGHSEFDDYCSIRDTNDLCYAQMFLVDAPKKWRMRWAARGGYLSAQQVARIKRIG